MVPLSASLVVTGVAVVDGVGEIDVGGIARIRPRH
jgi:hypothetical protein